MGRKSRRSGGITITSIGPSGNQVLTLLVGGFVIGGVVVYVLPMVMPQIYKELDKASGGFLTNVNKQIHGGLKWLGLEK